MKIDVPTDYDISDMCSWANFFSVYNPTTEFLLKHYDKIINDGAVYALLSWNKSLDESILDKVVQDKRVNFQIWDYLFVYQDISQEYLEKYLNNDSSHKVNFSSYVATHVKMSLDFILKYKDKILSNGSQLIYNKKIELPLDFIYEHLNENQYISNVALRERKEYTIIKLIVKKRKFECLKDKHGNIAFVSNYKNVILFCSKDEEAVKKFISSKLKSKIETFEDWAIRTDQKSWSYLYDYIGSGYRSIKQQDKDGKMVKFFNQLRKIPASSCKVYRGIKLHYDNREEFEKTHVEGGIVEVDCITSVSKNEFTAEDFRNGYGYVLEIDAKDVKMIDEVNKSEAEGFLLKGSKLKVKKVNKDTHRIHLEQV